LIKLFHDHPVLRRRHFFQGREIRGSEVKDLIWFRPDGKEMTGTDWDNGAIRCMGLSLGGEGIYETDPRGNRIVDDTLLILLNSYHEPLSFVLPKLKPKTQWQLMLDTREGVVNPLQPVNAGVAFKMASRSLAMFRAVEGIELTIVKLPPARPRAA
jgi:glycogen operon protein